MSTSSRDRNPASRRAWQAPAVASLPVRATAHRGAGAYVDTFTIGERPPWGTSLQAPPRAGGAGLPRAACGPLRIATEPARRPWQAPAVTALPVGMTATFRGQRG